MAKIKNVAHYITVVKEFLNWVWDEKKIENWHSLSKEQQNKLWIEYKILNMCQEDFYD